MNKLLQILFLIGCCATLIACNTTPKNQVEHSKIHVTLLHFNDIYEITPVSGGAEGGIARVATLRKQLLARNPNTITTLGGDLLSPSALGTAQYEGDALAGRQMVDVLNQLRLDYATFGNHEFDIKEHQFYQRLHESKFTWVSSNVLDIDQRPFETVKSNLIIPITDPNSGRTFRIGLFGVTLNANKAPFVRYADPFVVTGRQIDYLSRQVDFIIAMTHQFMEDDSKLLQAYPQIGLVLGGHDHVNYQHWRGNFTPILKSDANVRSVYVVDLYFDTQTGQTEVKPTFVPINSSLTEDPDIKKIVDKWQQIAFDAFRQQGFEPEAVVTTTTEALDGLESNVRNHPTNLTRLVASSMLRPYPEAELSLFNSGAIRLDDILPAGKVTEYDVIRILPFGGKILLTAIRGNLLQKVLNQGIVNLGSGGYLQSANTQQIDGVWHINGAAIDPSRIYKMAINDFLASGKEYGLGYLKPGNPDFTILTSGENTDIRKTVIDQLKKP